MSDRVFEAFLACQRDQALVLTQDSDVLHLVPIGDPPDRYLALFTCCGLVRDAAGPIVEADRFEVGICFHHDYLRSASTFRVLTWLGPRHIWHPNISNELPAVCVGHLAPGTSLVDILYQLHEMITWNKFNMREDDSLNPAACQWARHNLARLPVDRRPLKRRALDLRLADLPARRPANGVR